MKIIYLTMKEQQRAAILSKLANKYGGKILTAQVAESLGLSERQVYRLKARVRAGGIYGLAHGNRGKPSFHRMSQRREDRIVRLALIKYKGFNDQHLTEKLSEEEGIVVSRRKVSYLLRSREIGPVLKRRRPKHRLRRERMPREGMLLQTDGSRHDWLEERGPKLTLIGLIDDATNFVPEGFFNEQETTMGYFKLFYETFSKKGLPLSIYADRHMIFKTYREPTLEEQLQNKKPETQIGRALRELGITLIPAYSSQAKGRIERLWGTFQDRLVSELRLAKAKTKQEANRVVKKFLPDYNRRFMKEPKDPVSAWRPLPKGIDLLQILCVKEQRVVANDNTVSYNGVTFQIPSSSRRDTFAKAKVEVRFLLTGEIQIYCKEQCVAKFPLNTIQLNALQQKISIQDDMRYTPESQERRAA